MSWTKEELHNLVKTKLVDRLFVVVSNREPYVHILDGGEVSCTVPASGLTLALDPVMQASGGIWVAHGSGDADRQVVDDNDRVAVPPDNPSYTLRRVWLTKEEVDRYYLGFSNEALWPLCHITFTRPQFDKADWETYVKVNKMFAEAVLDEIGNKKALIFIQDYHLALLSRLIKSKNKKAITAQFWHIPWPNPEAFRICPWQEEMLDGLLGNNLIGFHIAYHRNNFLETVNRTLECKIDYERYAVSRHGTTTLARSFPISIDFDLTARNAAREEVGTEIKLIREQWGITDQFVGIGVDRIDYTKGIPERLKALDLFLTKYPQYLGKVVLFQLGDPSRIHIKKYSELNAEVDALVEEINWKYRSGNGGTFKPIIYLRGHKTQAELSAYYRMADFCIVSSLHDGMNQVAKEYVASRTAEDGVLILSKFTGASRELTEARLINPYDIDDIAEAIKEAIETPKEAQREKMVNLQNTIKNNNIYRWAGEIISELVKFGGS